MNVRCPGCNATLKFLPELGKMSCSFCGNTYSPNEINKNDTSSNSSEMSDSVKMRKRNFETIKVQMALCTSCGADLAMTDVEVSSFCPYCGQATIIKDRIDDYMKPDCIIPFKITQDEAYKIIKDSMENIYFIPNEFKNVTIEMLRGIYIPFWLYDIYCEDEQKWKLPNHEASYANPIMIRAANANFKNLTVDGLKQLNDESSQRLEPYDLSELVPFNVSYLSGFYADRFNEAGADTKLIAKGRVISMLYESVKEAMPSGSALLSRHPKVLIEGEKYALLPAWFLTFRYDDKTYTALVNGQTGKLVSAYPYSKKKIAVFVSIFSVLFSLITWKFWSALVTTCDARILALLAFMICFIGGIAFHRIKHVNDSLALTTSSTTRKYVTKRQADINT